VDSRALNFAIRAETGFDRAADDISVEERREHLVRQMSRWRVKSSTLEFVPCTSPSHSQENNIGAALNRQQRHAVASVEAEVSL
jgi:hypothetical protein